MFYAKTEVGLRGHTSKGRKEKGRKGKRNKRKGENSPVYVAQPWREIDACDR